MPSPKGVGTLASRAVIAGASRSQVATIWLMSPLPGSVLVPKVCSTSGRSLLRRTTMMGRLRMVASSWMPPKAEMRPAACRIAGESEGGDLPSCPGMQRKHHRYRHSGQLAQDGGQVRGIVGVFGSMDGRQHVVGGAQA